MILNFNTAVFMGQACLSLILVLACFVLILVIHRHPAGPGAPSSEGKQRLDHRLLLLGSVLICLLAIRLLSWLGFFWLMESYVAHVPGAMCPFGVDAATPGESRTLQWSRLAVFFAGGGWVSFYAVHWLSRKQAFHKSLVGLAVPLLLLVAFDCVADLRFTTAKREGVEVSCCTTVRETPSIPSNLPANASSDFQQNPPALTRLFLLGAVLAGLGWVLSNLLGKWDSPKAAPLVLPGLSVLGLYFLLIAYGDYVAVISPRLLGLPFHRCPFELVTRTPDFALIALLSLLGGFAPLWACCLATLSSGPSQVVRSALLRLSASGVTIALAMVATHWGLAP